MNYTEKKRQHYVWQKYLNNWLTDNQLFCLSKGNKNIFRTTTKNIALEKRFYKITNINKNDFEKIKKIINGADDKTQKYINERLNLILSSINLINALDNILDSDDIIKKNKNMLQNIFEEFNCERESDGVLLDNILNRNLSFLKNEDNRFIFYYFITTQYYRTDRMRMNVTKEFEDIDNSFVIYYFVSSAIMATGLFSKKLNHYILENNTDLPFITCDQPIINTDPNCDYNNSNKKLEYKDFKFYYPLSPKIAFLISPNKESDNDKIVLRNTSDILFYNKKIYSAALSQVYSNNEKALKDIIN